MVNYLLGGPARPRVELDRPRITRAIESFIFPLSHEPNYGWTDPVASGADHWTRLREYGARPVSDDDLRERLDRLESLVEDQQETIEEQQETIEDQRERVAELESADTDEEATAPTRPVSRRDAIKAGGLVGLFGLGAGTASADPQGHIGTDTDPLQTLYTEELDGGVTGGTAVSDLHGAGLSIASGALKLTHADLFDFGSSTGVISEHFGGLDINSPTDGEVTIPAGSGYVADATSSRTRSVDWTETVLGPFTPDTSVSIGVDHTGTPATGVGASSTSILLGEVVTDSNQRIAVLKESPQVVDHNSSRIDRVLRLAFKNLVVTGLVVQPNGSTQLTVTEGTYVFGDNIYSPSGGSTVTWGEYYLDSNNNPALRNESLSEDTVPAKYNVPGNTPPLQPIPAGNFARHAFYVVGEGATEQYVLLYSQKAFSSLTNAANAGVPPRPAVLSGNVALIASIIVDDTGGIVEIIDERRKRDYCSLATVGGC